MEKPFRSHFGSSHFGSREKQEGIVPVTTHYAYLPRVGQSVLLSGGHTAPGGSSLVFLVHRCHIAIRCCYRARLSKSSSVLPLDQGSVSPFN
jgi:hypothetical protein